MPQRASSPGRRLPPARSRGRRAGRQRAPATRSDVPAASLPPRSSPRGVDVQSAADAAPGSRRARLERAAEAALRARLDRLRANLRGHHREVDLFALGRFAARRPPRPHVETARRRRWSDTPPARSPPTRAAARHRATAVAVRASRTARTTNTSRQGQADERETIRRPCRRYQGGVTRVVEHAPREASRRHALTRARARREQ
jgi:hypothetical protein